MPLQITGHQILRKPLAQKGVEDFVGISEANLGVNKANYFVSRSIKHDVIIAGDGSVTGKTSLVLKNDSDKWPGGDYKVYLRFITPPKFEFIVNRYRREKPKA